MNFEKNCPPYTSIYIYVLFAGRLALHCAARHGWAQIVERLLQVQIKIIKYFFIKHTETDVVHETHLGRLCL